MQSACSAVPKSKSRIGAAANIEYGEEDKTAPKDSWPKALRLRNGALMQQTDLICAVGALIKVRVLAVLDLDGLD